MLVFDTKTIDRSGVYRLYTKHQYCISWYHIRRLINNNGRHHSVHPVDVCCAFYPGDLSG